MVALGASDVSSTCCVCLFRALGLRALKGLGFSGFGVFSLGPRV